jgi:hypothetical protein
VASVGFAEVVCHRFWLSKEDEWEKIRVALLRKSRLQFRSCTREHYIFSRGEGTTRILLIPGDKNLLVDDLKIEKSRTRIVATTNYLRSLWHIYNGG